MDTLQHIDISLLRFIQQHRIEALDTFFYGVSFFATYVNILIILSILILSIYKKSKPHRIIFFKLVVVFIVAATVSFLVKSLVGRDRPFTTYPDIEKLSEGGSSSFPSGHTLEAFALATAISIAFPRKKFIIPAFTWACLIAYSRMVLGVHYPGDILGGMIIGILIGWIISMIFKRGSGKAWGHGSGEAGSHGR